VCHAEGVFETGYLTIARWKGIPIRFHWSAPVGAFVFGRFSFVPGFWVAFLVLIVWHELGHAFLVRRSRLPVEAVEVHGLGGVCRYSGYPSPFERSVIAWGGVLAQGLLLAVTLLVTTFLWQPTSAIGLQVVSAFTWTNLWLIGINLLPIPPLDGHEAWKVFRHFRAGRGKPKRRRPSKTMRKSKKQKKKDGGDRAEYLRVVDGELRVVEDEVQETVRNALEEARKGVKKDGRD